MPGMRLLRLGRYGIFKQLRLEEAIFRAGSGSWCILSRGREPPSIVMGISGKPEALIDVPYARRAGFEVIKRFTGGGTVVVDSNTLFVTLIGDADAFGLDPWPRSIMSWTEGLYRPVLGKDDFRLVENDYCIGSRKVGGNAQAVSRGRFVHHTSFLWDFDPDNMRSLLLPSKRPDYRGDRSHGDFLCTLRGRFDDPVQFEDAIVSQVEAVVGSVESVTVEEAEEALGLEHRQSTKIVEI